MSGEYLALGVVGLLAAAGASRRGSGNEQPTQGTIDRCGFPWPVDTPLYHGTYAMDAIARQGFRTREGGAPSMTGGGHKHSVSTTVLLPRAGAIAFALDTLARVAQRRMSLRQLVEALVRDAPETAEWSITSLADWVRSLSAVSWRDPGALDSICDRLDLLDEGWIYVYLYEPTEAAPYKLPPGSISLDDRGVQYLIPPGSPLPVTGEDLQARAQRQCSDHSLRGTWIYKRTQGAWDDRYDAAYQIYKAVLNGPKEGGVFNPMLIGTDVRALTHVPLSSIGVLEVHAEISRICTDEKGAVALGYLQRHDHSRAEKMTSWYRDCDDALEGREWFSDFEPPSERELFGLWDTWVRDPVRWQGWAVRQQGRRTRQDTMLYYEGEQEVRIYDPSRIRVVRRISVDELRRRFGLEGRVTWPWFDGRKADVTIWRRK